MFQQRFRRRPFSREGALALAAFFAGALVIGTAYALLRADHQTTPSRKHTQTASRSSPKTAPSLALASLPKTQRPTLPSKPAVPPTAAAVAFAEEQKLSYSQLMSRWNPTIAAAAERFRVPPVWIHAVMQVESGGRTMMAPDRPITSSAGAEGLMQLMPETYDEMRKEHALGGNPFDPHDNIFAGAAYLAWLRGKYGYPQMFAAYNDGPGHLDERLAAAQLLPLETRNYLGNITAMLNGRRGHGAALARLTRPNGEAVMIDAGAVSSLRAPFPGEYAPGVLAVITTGKLRQGVTESVPRARAILRAHGAGI